MGQQSIIVAGQVLTDKNFNKTCFAEGAKSVVFFNDVEEDGERKGGGEITLNSQTKDRLPEH